MCFCIGSKSDCYVTLHLPTASSNIHRTKTVDNSSTPEWNETFDFRVQTCVKVSHVIIFGQAAVRAWVYDHTTSDQTQSTKDSWVKCSYHNWSFKLTWYMIFNTMWRQVGIKNLLQVIPYCDVMPGKGGYWVYLLMQMWHIQCTLLELLLPRPNSG